MAKVMFVINVPIQSTDDTLKDGEKIKTKEKDKINISSDKSKMSEEREKHVMSGWNFDDMKNKNTQVLNNVTSEKISKDENGPLVKNVELKTNDFPKDDNKKSNLDCTHSGGDDVVIKIDDASAAVELVGPHRKRSNSSTLEMDAPDGKARTRKNSLIALFHQSASCNNMNEKYYQDADVNLKSGKKASSVMIGSEEDPKLESFLPVKENLLEIVKDTLAEMGITGVQWSTTGDSMEVGMFIADDGEICEELIKRLTHLKISINVFPASISIASLQQKEEAEKLKQILEKEDKLAEKVSEFKKSIKSRLVVAQVVDAVRSDAVFNFDFLMLVTLASMVALMGLLEASSVALVASMLISPLMGPIIAGVFGTVIRNRDLLLVGFRSEIKGLSLCILIGFVFGFIPAILETCGLQWRATDNWPTIEMSSRGSLRSLLVGVLIALPSGAGVALSILGGKVGSLVGVAISASLLPPAVNAGLLWANAIVVAIKPPPIEMSPNASMDALNSHSLNNLNNRPLLCPVYVNNDFTHEYFCDMAKESAVLGVVSLLLTVLNIICIIIMGIVVLKIKEVAPIHSAAKAEHDFFAEDIKIARESYQTTKGQDSNLLGRRFLEEYRNVKNDIGVDDNSDDDENELHKIVEEVEDSSDVKEIFDHMPHKPKRWSAYMSDEKHDSSRVYNTIQIGNFNSDVGNDGIQLRRRRQNSGDLKNISFDTSESNYYTIHRLPTPRTSAVKFHLPKTGRFKVDRVTEKSPLKTDLIASRLPTSPPKLVLESQPLLSESIKH